MNDIPDVAIVDPDMMASMPAGLTAATGMDALTHAIEGYTTKGHGAFRHVPLESHRANFEEFARFG